MSLSKPRKALFRPTGQLSTAARLVGTAALLLAGCNASVPTVVAPAIQQQESSNTTEITLYLPGMNAELQILGGDGPNKVKQALLELDGVESVEDEWERELEAEEDLDLLFVRYNTNKLTQEKLIAKIVEHGFEAQVKEDTELNE